MPTSLAPTSLAAPHASRSPASSSSSSSSAPGALSPGPVVDRVAEQLAHHRVLLLDRELDQDNGARLCAELLLLALEDPFRDITLLINSPGGLVPAMLAIGDLMDTIPCDVRTVALGMAYSAGQFLLTHGAPGKRYILPHGTVLMHQGSAGFGGSAADIEIQAQDLRRNRDLLIAITARRTGRSIETITRDSERDRMWQAEDAVAYGFCDHIVAGIEDVVPALRGGGPGAAPVGFAEGTQEEGR